MIIKPLAMPGAQGKGADTASLDDFVRVPWALYADDPHWVPPLRLERKSVLSPKEPFFAHADWQGWVGYEGSTPVARITAQVDHLYEPRHGEKVGYFGMLEAPDEQQWFDALFERASDWLRARGRTRAVGPFNLGINQEAGLLVDGFDSPPFVMMGHHRPYYGARVEQAGFEPVQDLLACVMDPRRYHEPRVVEMLQRRRRHPVTVRTVDKRRLDEELATMRDIFNDAWSDNWGFVPFTEAEFQAVGRELLMITPVDFVRIAEIDGRAVGFIVLLPDLNALIRDLDGSLLPFGWAKLLWRLKARPLPAGRVPLMGVRKEYHYTKLGPGLSFALIGAVQKQAVASGMTQVEMSWILESNKGMRSIIESIGGSFSKRYRMYSRSLELSEAGVAPAAGGARNGAARPPA